MIIPLSFRVVAMRADEFNRLSSANGPVTAAPRHELTLQEVSRPAVPTLGPQEARSQITTEVEVDAETFANTRIGQVFELVPATTLGKSMVAMDGCGLGGAVSPPLTNKRSR